MRLAWAFLKRDFTIELSYKISFAVQILGTLVLLLIFSYLGMLMNSEEIPALEKYGGSYMAFLLIGVSLTDCVTVSQRAFAKQIREGQLTGSLEVTLMSPVSLSRILIYSAIWPNLFSAIRFLIYLTAGTVLYQVGLENANIPAALVMFILAVTSFAGLGMIWAGIVLIIKRGESLITIVTFGMVIISGTLFPAELLPKWLQYVGMVIPLFYALDGMRLALLQGHSIADLGQSIGIMILFSTVLITVGLLCFTRAVEVAKHNGTLSQY